MEERRYFLNGSSVPRERFVIHAEDDGLLRGLSAFETMRTYNGQIFRPEAHVQRLLASAQALGIPSVTSQEILQELAQAVHRYPVTARAQITLTVGGQRLVHVTPADLSVPGAPMRVISLPWEPPEWLNGRVKHCSRAAGQVARRSAGADEVFWVGRDGCLTEGARTNIFAVIEGKIVTPPDDGRILCGVTRAAMLEAGRKANLPVEESPIHRDTVPTELYASSTLRDLAPVIELDGVPAPGKGPLGDQLQEAFQNLVRTECGS